MAGPDGLGQVGQDWLSALLMGHTPAPGHGWGAGRKWHVMVADLLGAIRWAMNATGRQASADLSGEQAGSLGFTALPLSMGVRAKRTSIMSAGFFWQQQQQEAQQQEVQQKEVQQKEVQLRQDMWLEQLGRVLE
jgi:hypothetical protein